ncbi:MAG: cupin domain-containing protein [Nitrospinae bacterium]|nr:cupin domain-containing protein [Nitrospinota bacterium]
MSYVFDWDDGEKIEMVDIELPRGWRILIDPRNTNSRMLSMGNQDIPVGGGIPVHLHEKEEEILFFHEGEADVQVDGKVYQVKAGMTAFLPVGVEHGLRNTGDVPLKLLWIFGPPGYEEIFRHMSDIDTDHGKYEELHPRQV